MLMSRHPLSDKPGKTLALFSYDWDAIEFGKLHRQWPHLHAGFDLFSSPSSMRLAWFDMDRFCTLAALKGRILGARGVVSNHEQFGALCAALLAENMQWPGTPVEAVLACQHKLYAREVLQRVAPQANIPFARLDTAHGGNIPEGLFSDEEIDAMSHTEAPFINPDNCVGCGLCEYRCHSALVKQQKQLSQAAIYVTAQEQ